MDKYGVVNTGYTPKRANEETVEQLDDCLEKRAADAAEEKSSKEAKANKEAK